MFVKCAVCPSLHTQCLDSFECTNSALHFLKLLSVDVRLNIKHLGQEYAVIFAKAGEDLRQEHANRSNRFGRGVREKEQ